MKIIIFLLGFIVLFSGCTSSIVNERTIFAVVCPENTSIKITHFEKSTIIAELVQCFPEQGEYNACVYSSLGMPNNANEIFNSSSASKVLCDDRICYLDLKLNKSRGFNL